MRAFSDFFEYLGCPLVNARWSWSAISPDGRRVLFTIWSDEVKKSRYILYPPSERRPREIAEEADLRLGALEIQRIAAIAAQDSTIEAYGVLSVAKDPRAVPRERKSYDDRTVFRIRVEKIEDTYVAHLTDRVPASAVAGAGRGGL